MNKCKNATSWTTTGLITLLSTLLLLISPTMGRAEVLLYTIATNKAVYDPGDVIQWQIFVDIGGSTDTNFGAATLTVDLADSFGDKLIAGSINKATSPSFVAYDMSSPGTWSDEFGKMYEISALKFLQSPSAVGIHGGQLNNILFASGSMTATSAGVHILSGTAGSTNTYFTASEQSFVLAADYATVSFSNATFTVTAVPEPSSIVLLSIVGCICLVWWARAMPRPRTVKF